MAKLMDGAGDMASLPGSLDGGPLLKIEREEKE